MFTEKYVQYINKNIVKLKNRKVKIMTSQVKEPCEGCSLYICPNNENEDKYYQKWIYCFEKYSPA